MAATDDPPWINSPDEGLKWLAGARELLASLATVEKGIEVTLGNSEISSADAPAIDFLDEHVRIGIAWLEQHPAGHADIATELRAALGVLRNLVFAVRRLSSGQENVALRRSCDALIAQSRLHAQAAALAIDVAIPQSS